MDLTPTSITGRDWYFVNKDPKSNHLSRSTQRDRFLIHSHVQGRWRRDKAQRRGKGRKSKGNEAEAETSIGNGDSLEGVNDPRQCPLDETTINDLDLYPKAGESYKKVSIICRVSRQRPWSKPNPTTSHSDTPCSPPGNSVDPFGTAPVRIDAQVHQLLQFYRYVFHSRMWCTHSDGFAHGQDPTCCLDVNDYLRNCFAKPMTMFSTLACSTNHKAKWSASKADTLTPFFVQRAIAALRVELNRPMSSPTQINLLIWGICLLWFVEAGQLNVSACAMHISGANALMNAKPGCTKTHLKSLVDKLTVRTAWFTMRTMHNLPESSLAHSVISKSLPVDDANNILLSLRFRTILGKESQAAIELLHNFGKVFEAEIAAGLPSDQSMLLSQFNEASSSLDLQFSCISTMEPMAQVLMAAIRMWRDYVFPQSSSIVNALLQAAELAARLQSLPMKVWEHHLDGLLWICTVGTMLTAHLHAVAPPGLSDSIRDDIHTFFLLTIGKLIESGTSGIALDDIDRDSLARFSKQFLYLDAFQSRIMHIMSVNIRSCMNADKSSSRSVQRDI